MNPPAFPAPPSSLTLSTFPSPLQAKGNNRVTVDGLPASRFPITIRHEILYLLT